ncbi:MAG: putative toxin-antitoxin system toxin component, PIN family [Candidatus Scalindua sp.]
MTIRIVIDTNIWVSSLLNPTVFLPNYENLLKKVFLLSSYLIQCSKNLQTFLTGPRIKNKYGISEKDIKNLLILIEERSEHVLITGNISICRDKDDDAVIETAINGQALFLVTRDDDIKSDK